MLPGIQLFQLHGRTAIVTGGSKGLGEAMALAEKSGIEPQVFYDIVTSTAMNSNSHKNYGKLMLENPDKPSFPLRLEIGRAHV